MNAEKNVCSENVNLVHILVYVGNMGLHLYKD